LARQSVYYDVTIHLDEDYVVAGSGYLQNPEEIGYGYEAEGQKVRRPKGDKLHWHFVAPNVHDFVWAADKEYEHQTLKYDDNLMLHYFYQKDSKTKDIWKLLPNATRAAFEVANEKYGRYPYKQYSFIQGGDGGMEYPMATLISGDRSFSSLLGTATHEMMHAWYQGMMGSNESLYAWMDEGFTSYASTVINNELKRKGFLGDTKPDVDPFEGTYSTYTRFLASGKAEPIAIHADHYQSNAAYSVAAYINGSVFLNQLEYVVGKENLDQGLLKYYDTWRFKHPNPNDFIRVMEKQSGLELDWYKEYMMNTLHTIDYSIKTVEKESRKESKIILERVGNFPMPIDVVITYKDGSKDIYNIPLDIMRGEKPNEWKNAKDTDYFVAPDWQWVNTTYELTIPARFKKIDKVELDPSGRMADGKKDNNMYDKE
jgi:hypothetical protein